jgi:hypothetical protein
MLAEARRLHSLLPRASSLSLAKVPRVPRMARRVGPVASEVTRVGTAPRVVVEVVVVEVVTAEVVAVVVVLVEAVVVVAVVVVAVVSRLGDSIACGVNAMDAGDVVDEWEDADENAMTDAVDVVDTLPVMESLSPLGTAEKGDRNDRMLCPKIVREFEDKIGRPFTLEACTNVDGSNAVCLG